MMCSLVFHRKLGYFLSCRMLPCILLLVQLWCALNHINKLYIPNDASNGLFLSTCPPLTTGWWHLVYHTSHCWWSYDWNVDVPNFGTDMNRSWLANRSRLLNHLLLISSFTSPCNNHNLSLSIYIDTQYNWSEEGETRTIDKTSCKRNQSLSGSVVLTGPSPFFFPWRIWDLKSIHSTMLGSES